MKKDLRYGGVSFAVALVLAGFTLAVPGARIVGTSLAAPVAAPPATDFASALKDGDLPYVRRVAEAAHRPPGEVALARAAIAYWLHQDASADAALSQSAVDSALSENLRRSAWALLSGLRLRQGRYADAAAVLDKILPGTTDAEERKDFENTKAFCLALAGVAPLTAEIGGPGSIPLTRDRMTLNRAQITINGGALDAIVDTGSGVSTISEGNARRLGLHILSGEVAIGTATSADVKTGIAWADRMTFGGATFHNVVFIVMPDAALTFGNGAYVVQAIVGLPVISELGRVEYTVAAGQETLHYSRGEGVPGAASNLILPGTEVLTFAQVDGTDKPLRLFIDNGARASHLNRRFVAEFPDLAARTHSQSVTRTGGAGSETQAGAKLPRLDLHFGAATATVNDVDVVDDQQRNRHGDLGLDALRTASGYILDFKAMRFELLAPARH